MMVWTAKRTSAAADATRHSCLCICVHMWL